MAPDLANLSFIWRKERLPESSPYILASRIMHSPLTVVALLVITRGRAWPYALHWAADVASHPLHCTLWPFVKEN